jgi:predicted acylesterase/phospholipase RssA
MAVKVSLVMSGAVSLGSFHAGVVTELLHALDWFCAHGQPCELDVITGASAGSITAAVVANVVMNDFTQRINLHEAWIKDINIEDLLQDAPDNAFLSQAPIFAIASKRLAARLVQRAPFAPVEMRVGFTLSNMNGVDRQLQSMKGSFRSTFFDDHKTYRLASEGDIPPTDRDKVLSVQRQETWEDVSKFAIASGGFPFAFAPMKLTRYPWEYALLAPNFFANQSMDFFYVDGGTFNNQPLGEAVWLSRLADQGSPGQPRKYVFVSANVNNSMYEAKFGDPQATTWQTARRLALIIFAQSRTSDWIRSLLINDQVQWRNDVFRALAELVRDTTVVDPGGFLDRLRNLAATMLPTSQQHPGARAPQMSVQELFDATAAKFKPLLDQVAAARPGLGDRDREVLIWLFLLLDHVSDLDERKQIDIIEINPEGRLAGEQLEAFGGFFEENWREYNFRQGRIIAHRQLANALGDYPKEASGDYEIPDDWEGFPKATLKATNRAARERFRDRVVSRVLDIVQMNLTSRWPLSWLIRRGISNAVRSRLNNWLELS